MFVIEFFLPITMISLIIIVIFKRSFNLIIICNYLLNFVMFDCFINYLVSCLVDYFVNCLIEGCLMIRKLLLFIIVVSFIIAIIIVNSSFSSWWYLFLYLTIVISSFVFLVINCHFISFWIVIVIKIIVIQLVIINIVVIFNRAIISINLNFFVSLVICFFLVLVHFLMNLLNCSIWWLLVRYLNCYLMVV